MVTNHWGLHARTLSGSRWVVFLHLAGDTGACGASFAGNQGAGAGGSEGPGPSFGKLYSSEGRPSIPPEQLLSALLLQAFYSIRSERQLMEQLDYNLLYRWFVGLAPDDPVWDATTFTKNRERLQHGDVFQKFMTKLLNHPQVKPLLSDEHFSVDGTLIEAWASQKSFKPKDGSGGRWARTGTTRSARTKRMRARRSREPLYRKAAGREAKLCYMGHVAMENRHGLAVAGMVTSRWQGGTQRLAHMLKAKRKAIGHRLTAGADKAYDTSDHVATLRAIDVTPHVAQNQSPTKTGKTARARSMAAPHAMQVMACRRAPQGDRMHFRLGQAARHPAQDQAPRRCPRWCRVPDEPHRL